MITVTHVVGGKFKGSFGQGLKGSINHKVKVRITGKSDLAKFSDILRDTGHTDDAATILAGTKSATVTMPAAMWEKLGGRS